MEILTESATKQETGKKVIFNKIDELNRHAWEIHITQPKLGLELSNEAKELSEKNNYQEGIAYAIRNMGVSNRYLSNLETALSLSLQALEMFIELGDRSGEAQAYVSIGAIYYYMGDFERGLDYFLKGLYYAEGIGNKEAETYGYNGAGYIYGVLGDNKRGLEFLHKALELSKEIKNDDLQASILDSLAVGFLKDNQIEKAYETYIECLNFSMNRNQMRNQGYALSGIGQILVKKNRIEDAKVYFLKSLSIHEEIGYKTGPAATLLHLGKLFLQQNNFEQAKVYLEKSLDVSESIKAMAVIYQAHEALAELFERREDFKSFVEHYKLYHKYKSEFFKVEQENKQKYLAVQQEMDKLKQDAEINRLKNVVLKEKNDELENKTNDLEQSYNNVSVLSKIGQDITSTLNLDIILNTVYKNVNQLMDASIFGIGIYNPHEQTIDYRLAIENGKRYKPYRRTMEDKNQLPVWCIENKKEVFIKDVVTEFSNYIKENTDKELIKKIMLEDGTQAIDPFSYIYLPLLVKDEVIGLITVQSFKKDAYTPYQLDILKTLASYTAAALFNAQSYETIQNTLNELKHTQEQLVQAEKLSSLGQLTAGIAHEINNPINFVSSNVEPLKIDLSEIIELITRYEKVIKENKLESIFREVEEFRTEFNFEFTVKEVEELLKGIDEGAKRTSEIVKGLRNFSRLDQNVSKFADLNEGLESTLILLHNSYKHNIEITKDYCEIPEINCFAGQINQVFMNILSNAVQAIDGNGKIFIKTWTDGDIVKISIRDTGSGMSEEISKKIFDPFFTTKEVGKGTGLGLSITYGIIEKHKGKIEVFSELGSGTEFIISLPINQDL
ncbi:MAG: hypothetical protein HW421_351 [Ignavibacteria bacterium]|nr:hypothetical protein [Ignavibacteria bacterium]